MKPKQLPTTQFYRRMYKASGHISGLSTIDGPYHLFEWHGWNKTIAERWRYHAESGKYELTEKRQFDRGACCAMYRLDRFAL